MASADLFDRPNAARSIVRIATEISTGQHPRKKLSRKQIIDVSILFDALFVFAAFNLSMRIYAALATGELRDNASYTLVNVLGGLILLAAMRV